MAISLFSHNQITYDATVTMLAKTGKACVIHPTGTGKVLHRSRPCSGSRPRSIFFKTQCENLLATGAEVPENISFMTYAKLSLLSREELAGLCPALIWMPS